MTSSDKKTACSLSRSPRGWSLSSQYNSFTWNMVLKRPFSQETELSVNKKDGLKMPFVSDTQKSLPFIFIIQVSKETKLLLELI